MKKDQVLEILKKEYGCWTCGAKDCIVSACSICQYYVFHDDLVEAIGAAIKLLEGEKDGD